jgi:hypothetical protein
MSSKPFRVNVGDRIAQIIPEMYLTSTMVEVNHIVSRIIFDVCFILYELQRITFIFALTYSQTIHLEVALDLAQLVFLMLPVSTSQIIPNKYDTSI